MSLSNYQGTYMNIHHAKRQRNDGDLGKEELRVLREKAKNGDRDAERKLRRYSGEYIKIENNRIVCQRKNKNEKKSVVDNGPWKSMQEKTNNLALELLKNAKNKE